MALVKQKSTTALEILRGVRYNSDQTWFEVENPDSGCLIWVFQDHRDDKSQNPRGGYRWEQIDHSSESHHNLKPAKLESSSSASASSYTRCRCLRSCWTSHAQRHVDRMVARGYIPADLARVLYLKLRVGIDVPALVRFEVDGLWEVVNTTTATASPYPQRTSIRTLESGGSSGDDFETGEDAIYMETAGWGRRRKYGNFQIILVEDNDDGYGPTAQHGSHAVAVRHGVENTTKYRSISKRGGAAMRMEDKELPPLPLPTVHRGDWISVHTGRVRPGKCMKKLPLHLQNHDLGVFEVLDVHGEYVIIAFREGWHIFPLIHRSLVSVIAEGSSVLYGEKKGLEGPSSPIPSTISQVDSRRKKKDSMYSIESRRRDRETRRERSGKSVHHTRSWTISNREKSVDRKQSDETHLNMKTSANSLSEAKETIRLRSSGPSISSNQHSLYSQYSHSPTSANSPISPLSSSHRPSSPLATPPSVSPPDTSAAYTNNNTSFQAPATKSKRIPRPFLQVERILDVDILKTPLQQQQQSSRSSIESDKSNSSGGDRNSSGSGSNGSSTEKKRRIYFLVEISSPSARSIGACTTAFASSSTSNSRTSTGKKRDGDGDRDRDKEESRQQLWVDAQNLEGYWAELDEFYGRQDDWRKYDGRGSPVVMPMFYREYLSRLEPVE